MQRRIRHFAEAYLAAAGHATDAKLPEIARRFVQALIRRRLAAAALPKILAMVERIWNERHGIVPVRMTTAAAVDETLLRELASDSPLSHRIEPKIIGGAIIEQGDERIDGSIRTALVRLRTELLTKEI